VDDIQVATSARQLAQRARRESEREESGKPVGGSAIRMHCLRSRRAAERAEFEAAMMGESKIRQAFLGNRLCRLNFSFSWRNHRKCIHPLGLWA
jgi:hypothetical protein